MKEATVLRLLGTETDFAKENGDTFLDVNRANSPFKKVDWFLLDNDVRWQFGISFGLISAN